MATLRLSTANHYTTTTTGGDSLVIVRDKVPGRKGIAGGKMLLETGEYKSTFLAEGVSTYEVKKFIVNGVIYEQHLDSAHSVGGGILAGGTTLAAVGYSVDLTGGDVTISGGDITLATARVLSFTGGDVTISGGDIDLEKSTAATLNNNRISAMHFQRPWEPIAMGE